jgi:hypothetical protein
MTLVRRRHRPIGFTVVQHAGFVNDRNAQFARGLQSTPLATPAERITVQKVGGHVFDSLQEAEEWAEREAYPIDYFGTNPIAQGRFSSECINGLPIYLPLP